jgi:membrane fusion protein (multidrug efflux system)
VKVSFPSVGETFDGILDHVGQFIDPSNRTFKVSVQVPDGQESHAPQPAQRHQHPGHAQRQRLDRPSRTVLQDVNGDNYIYVLDATRNDEAKARKVMVQRLSEYKGMISIARHPTPDGRRTLEGQGERRCHCARGRREHQERDGPEKIGA